MNTKFLILVFLYCSLFTTTLLAQDMLIDSADDFDAAWQDDDELWSNEQQEQSLGFSGFAELRAGQRIDGNVSQRRTSMAELRLQLQKDWLWQSGSARFTTDFIYDNVEKSHRVDLNSGRGWLDIREAWVQQKIGSDVDVKVGRQVLTWGVGDLVFINDLFAKDWNSFLTGRDEQYLKAPTDALRVGWYTDTLNVNVVYTPKFGSDRYIDGRRLSYFSPLAGQVVGQNQLLDVDLPNRYGSDDEWAVRLYRSINSIEAALYFYDGYWKSPGGFRLKRSPVGLANDSVVLGFAQPVGEGLFPRLQVLGASMRSPLANGIASVELGYYRSKDDSRGDNPLINNDEFRALLAYEWELLRNTTLAVQYYVEVLQNYSAYKRHDAAKVARDKDRHLLSLRLTTLAMSQRLTSSVFLFYSPSDQDAYLRPKLAYKASDNYLIEVGANVFIGQQGHTFFGQFESNSNVYVSLRYSF